MTFGSLFAGIGGMDLGLERAGMTCSWQVEIDPYARRVLERHWPDVRRWDDVRTFPPDDADWRVDLICGGFPCQPVSVAGKRNGVDDDRWLWPEFERILRVLRPRYALLENTPGLLTAGFDVVIGDLASLGFDAEWSVFSACSLGAAHSRERLFIVAYAPGLLGQEWVWFRPQRIAAEISARYDLSTSVLRMESAYRDRGVPDGVSRSVDRFRGCGNAVVPQVAEWIGKQIVNSFQKGL